MKIPYLAAVCLAAVPGARADSLVFDLRPPQAKIVTAPPTPTRPVKKAPLSSTPARSVAPRAPAGKMRVASIEGTQRTLVGRIGTVLYANVPIFDGPYQRKVYNYTQPGQAVLLTGWNSQWYGVRMIDGRTGWVYRGYVRLMPATVRIPEVVPRNSPQGYAIVGVSPLLRTAFGYMGIPYRWGGTSASGIDCSGFVRDVFRKYGVELPRVARDQARVGTPVPLSPTTLQPGDRLYFACHHSYVDHTGIYWGNGLFIHSSGGRGVDITPLWDGGIYEKGLVGARRTFAMG